MGTKFNYNKLEVFVDEFNSYSLNLDEIILDLSHNDITDKGV